MLKQSGLSDDTSEPITGTLGIDVVTDFYGILSVADTDASAEKFIADSPASGTSFALQQKATINEVVGIGMIIFAILLRGKET